MTTPGTASSTDARKRKAERETDEQPPQFPDTTNFNADLTGLLNRFCAEAPSGTPDFILSTFLQRVLQEFNEAVSARAEWRGEQVDLNLTPPPAPAPVWSVISEDRDQPTLAEVTLDLENHRWPRPGEWYVDNLTIFCRWSDDWQPLAHASHVTHVEVLHTHNPETHVPVERALIDEVVHHARFLTQAKAARPNRDLPAVLTDLAALADGAQS